MLITAVRAYVCTKGVERERTGVRIIYLPLVYASALMSFAPRSRKATRARSYAVIYLECNAEKCMHASFSFLRLNRDHRAPRGFSRI